METKRLVDTLPFTVRTSFVLQHILLYIIKMIQRTNMAGAVCAAYRVPSSSAKGIIL